VFLESALRFCFPVVLLGRPFVWFRVYDQSQEFSARRPLHFHVESLHMPFFFHCLVDVSDVVSGSQHCLDLGAPILVGEAS